ncbi:hypothetical protein BGZ83_011047 [Gryganskiella cystojenkinii]|nr:hypothetical protein BGZ83_011047 [Gryganskiella cystojenkinii]
MFAFNASGSSSTDSQGRSTRTSSTLGKRDYIPSAYIKKRLEEEETARRQTVEGGLPPSAGTTASNAFSNGDDLASHTHWRGPEEVLAPGYHSGPLGYHLPTPPSSQPTVTPTDDLEDDNTRQFRPNGSIHNVRFEDDGSGVGLGLQGSSSRRKRQDSVSSTTSKLYPDLGFGFNGSGGSSSTAFSDIPTTTSMSEPARRGIIRNDSRADLHLAGLGGGGGAQVGDAIKKNSVRFSTSAAREMGSPRPGTPSSIYGQGSAAASPFFSGSTSSLHSLKEDDKIDILGHRAAMSAGASALNSSLGPAVGSVSGGATQTSQYSTPRTQGELNVPSLRSTGFGSISAAGTAPFLGHDGSSLRQSGKLASPMMGKNSLVDDEEDKDKERYMPAVLLNYTPGLKGTKLEPFVDGKQDWESDSFQQAGLNSNGTPRPPPHLVGEDAPPGETLDEIAHKEGYYSRPTSSLSQFRRPLQDTRSDSEMGSAADSSMNGSRANSTAEEPYDSIITYGFPPEAASYILNQFRDFGTITRQETGTYGHKDDSFNWLKIQYSNAWSAKNACTRHLKPVGKFIVGVHACRSFSTRNHSAESAMAMDTSANDSSNSSSVGADLTETESREISAGVDSLLRMRSSGQDLFSVSRGQSALAKSARQASLSESWNQGNNNSSFGGFGQSLGFGESVSRRPTVVDTSASSGDEDMAFILGHSLTSGGTIGRPRGRDLERESGADFLRSTSKEQPLSGGQVAEQDSSAFGASGMTMDGSGLDSSAPAEFNSVGFRPLFGQNESRGLYSSSSGAGDSLLSRPSGQQQQLQQQQQQHQDSQQGQGGSSYRMSWRRPLGDSTASDSTLFASSGGVLLSGSTNSSSLHIPKKQRLSSSLFATTTGSGDSVWGGNSSTGASNGLKRFGRDRSSLLVDDPALVDDFGRSIQSGPSIPGSMALSSSSSGSRTNVATNSGGSTLNNGFSSRPAIGGNTVGGNNNGGSTAIGQGGQANKEPESMIMSALNMAKKRLFWG